MAGRAGCDCLDGGAVMMAHPKPVGAIDKLYDEQAGRYGPALDLSPIERQVLRHIANELDVLDVVTPEETSCGLDHWIVVRAPVWLLRCLAEFESDREDLEDGEDAEDGNDAEPEETDDDIETEPSLGSLNTQAQLGWAKNHSWILDGEDDDSDDEDSDQDDEHDGREPEDFVGGQTEPVMLPVYAAHDERPITRHTDLGEWRKL